MLTKQDFNSKMSDNKAIIKSVDMSEEMQSEAIECSTQALEKYNIEKDIAAHIKREFDRKYGKCVVHRTKDDTFQNLNEK